MNNEFVNNAESENKEKADTLLSLRTTKSKKEFIENFKVQANCKTADELVDKIISLIANQKVDENEKRFNLDDDINALDKAISNIKNVITGIDGKVNSEIDNIIKETNNKLNQKDAILLEAEATIKNIMVSAEEQFEAFKVENDKLVKEVEDIRKELLEAESNIISLDEDNKTKDIIINQLTAEKTKLDMQVADCVEAKKEMQVRINSLLDLEEENKRLKAQLEEANESNRNLKTELAIANNNLESKNNDIETLKLTIADKDNNISILTNEKSDLSTTITSKDMEIKNLISIKEELANKVSANEVALNERNNEISNLKEEYRDAIANMTIEHKEELLNIKEQIKEDLEKKYESKLEKLKDEIYSLKKDNKR